MFIVTFEVYFIIYLLQYEVICILIARLLRSGHDRWLFTMGVHKATLQWSWHWWCTI